MARTRSGNKDQSILTAATKLVAERGINVPTSLIAKEAGIAEGTLFTYFPTKSDLMDSLYIHLKKDLRSSVSPPAIDDMTLEERARLSWDRHVQWGITNPVKYKALKTLEGPGVVSLGTRAEIIELFPESSDLSNAYSPDSIVAQLGPDYVDSLFSTLANMTVELAILTPDRHKILTDSGFRILWSALGH